MKLHIPKMLKAWLLSVVTASSLAVPSYAVDTFNWIQSSDEQNWSDATSWYIEQDGQQVVTPWVPGSNITIDSDNEARNLVVDIDTRVNDFNVGWNCIANIRFIDGHHIDGTGSFLASGHHANITLSGQGSMSFAGNISLTGSNTIFTLGNGVKLSAVNLTTNNVGQQVNINGELNLTGIGGGGGLSMTGGTLNIGEGALINTSRLTTSDNASRATTINMTGGQLNITGNVNAVNGSGSFTLGH